MGWCYLFWKCLVALTCADRNWVDYCWVRYCLIIIIPLFSRCFCFWDRLYQQIFFKKMWYQDLETCFLPGRKTCNKLVLELIAIHNILKYLLISLNVAIANVQERSYSILLKNLHYESKILPKSFILTYCILNIFLTALTGEYFLHL